MINHVGSNITCDRCNITLTTKYGSGRFCSAKCARGFSTQAKRKEINNKVSNTLSGRPSPNPTWATEAQKKGAEANRQKKLNSFVKINGDVLDITYRELIEYRKNHPVCEICKREDVFLKHLGRKPQLAIDHCHKTKKFRGLLCKACNFRLGWFEGQQNNILKYLGS